MEDGKNPNVLTEFAVRNMNWSKSSTVTGPLSVTPAHGTLHGLPRKGWSPVGGSGREGSGLALVPAGAGQMLQATLGTAGAVAWLWWNVVAASRALLELGLAV